MDANGVTFWMLSEGEQFDFTDGNAIWDKRHRVLRLRSERFPSGLAADRDTARILANQSPVTLDKFGTFAALNKERSQVLAAGTLETPVPIFTAAAGQKILDMCMGETDVLYLAVGQAEVQSSVIMVDRRDRWPPEKLSAPDFIPDRIVARAGGGAWALDRGKKRVALIKGTPLPRRPLKEYWPDTARPCSENPDPPLLKPREDLAFPKEYSIVALAANPKDQTAVLLWPDNDTEEAVILLLGDSGLSSCVKLVDAFTPFAVGWVGDECWAVMFQGRNEAAVYRIPSDKPPEEVLMEGGHYPLRRGTSPPWANGPFCNSLSEPAFYQASPDGIHLKPRPLHSLSLPALARTARIRAARPFDSGAPGTIWHRIYMEASFPPGTGARIYLSAADDESFLEDAPRMEHRFGMLPSDPASAEADVPVCGWVTDASEIPFHPGMLNCPREKDVSGLFTVLVQRPGRGVRTLRGRYLQVWLELVGNGLSTPRIAAVRIYAPRFSYLDRYLPELYRETEYGPRADTESTATGADFLQRYLCLFEGILTPIEDKVAAAHVVTDPGSAPSEALDWLARWLGLTLLPELSVSRRRRLIAEASRLYRSHGTLRGLSLALDIATGNRVSSGDIVILEDYRLRRTFATILGADLADEEDPLMMGIVASGNSYVGDTLFLGEEEKHEFLALFLPETAESPEERDGMEEIFERLAHRITVLVHHETDTEELGLIHRIVALEIPAHVRTRILTISTPLLVGLSALVGVDSYMRQRPARRPARAGVSCIGRGDYIQGAGSLDPRLDSGPPVTVQPGMRRPIARAADVESEIGHSFTFDASDSEAFGDRKIDYYCWKFKNRGD